MRIETELFVRDDSLSIHVYEDKEWGDERLTVCFYEKNKEMKGDPDRVLSLTIDQAETLATMLIKMMDTE